jgi:demethylmenaquinone methyltransferase/2-methoxy-6-polyprenyl-1,4-benzoquinol methylase
METTKSSENFYDRIKPRLHERIGLELRGAKRVLDLGCGDCELVRYLADTYGQQVTGIDISGESFPDYQEIAKAGKNVRCIRKDANNLEFIYETLNAVVIMWALHEMRNPQAVLKEAHRVLRPDGEVLVVEFPYNSLAQKLWNENYYTSKELADSLRKAGFRDVQAKRIECKQILWVTGFRSKN